MAAAGKKPSTVRNAYFLVRMILGQAVADGALPSNPADYVKLPSNHTTGHAGAIDDPSQFLTPAQVSALTASMPWPYNVYVDLAVFSGLRPGEMAGLQVGDLEVLSTTRAGSVRVDRTLGRVGAELRYLTPKTKGSRRRVPFPIPTAGLLWEYLAAHPRRDDPTAPLFPAMSLSKVKPTGVRVSADGEPDDRDPAARQMSALAALTVTEAEARLVLDWDSPMRHATFSKSVFGPAVLRAITNFPRVALSPDVTPHSCRHTYASLSVAAGIPVEKLSRRMGHSKIGTTLSVYVHLFPDEDAAQDMAALGAMAAPTRSDNVIKLRG
ncbi:tyrosine-type recombinase/integrase [Mycobacterium sp. C31M]